MLKTLYMLVGLSVVAFLLLAFAPGLLEVDPVVTEREPSPPFEGPLEANNKLTSFEKLFPGELEGPESIALYKDNLCTGLANGKIVCVRDNKIKFITQIGNPSCDGRWEEEICGRPMGLRFDKNGTLYAVDAYFGLYKINITTGTKTALYKSNSKIDGKESKLVNNLDISKKGDVYFTISGSWPLKKMIFSFIESKPAGRILHYNPRTNKTKSLVEGINFANGIQLSPKEDFLIVSETVRNRVLRYYLKGPKKGNLEVFAENLPGFPDNIRLNPRGNYWIGLCGVRTPDHFPLLKYLNQLPLVRKAILRLLHLLQSFHQLSVEYVPVPVFFRELDYQSGHMHFYASLGSPNYGLIIELNQNGQIVQSLHDPTGSIRFISDVTEHNGVLYLGTPWLNFIGKLRLENKLAYNSGHMHFYASLGSPNYGLIIELNQNGQIVQSLHDPTGSIRFISEVTEHNGILYLGSTWHNFIGKLRLENKLAYNA